MPTAFRTSDEHSLEKALLKYIAARSDAHTSTINISKALELSVAAVDEIVSASFGEDQWLYFRLACEMHPAEIIRTQAGPVLSKLGEEHLIRGWWWLNKPDERGTALRVRIDVPGPNLDAVRLMLHRHWSGVALNPKVVCYEPEMRLMGGPSGLDLAHRIFCADSDFLYRWILKNPARVPFVPPGISLALVFVLMRAAGLDLFECWDVFEQLCELRRIGISPKLKQECRRITSRVVDTSLDEVVDSCGSSSQLVRSYADNLERFGKELQSRYFSGELNTGRRRFLVAVILFHWNRAGFVPALQSALAVTVRDHLLSFIDKKGCAPPNHGTQASRVG